MKFRIQNYLLDKFSLCYIFRVGQTTIIFFYSYCHNIPLMYWSVTFNSQSFLTNFKVKLSRHLKWSIKRPRLVYTHTSILYTTCSGKNEVSKKLMWKKKHEVLRIRIFYNFKYSFFDWKHEIFRVTKLISARGSYQWQWSSACGCVAFAYFIVS